MIHLVELLDSAADDGEGGEDEVAGHGQQDHRAGRCRGKAGSTLQHHHDSWQWTEFNT